MGNSPDITLKKFKELAGYLSAADLTQAMPVHSQKMHQIAEDQAYFDKVRENFNQLGLSRYEGYRKEILCSEDPFGLAIKMAIAGNNLDPAAPDNDVNIEQAIEIVLEQGLAIDESVALRERLNASSTVLYLADNTGELIFDDFSLKP
jgi:uncharacterized protein with ATP-grasp and redox domains